MCHCTKFGKPACGKAFAICPRRNTPIEFSCKFDAMTYIEENTQQVIPSNGWLAMEKALSPDGYAIYSQGAVRRLSVFINPKPYW